MILCDSAAVAIGRADLQSPKVSSHHAVIRKLGQETHLQSFGSNGTFRWNGSQWKPLEAQAILQNEMRPSSKARSGAGYSRRCDDFGFLGFEFHQAFSERPIEGRSVRTVQVST